MIEVYTDGSCNPNGIFPNKGTFAYILVKDGEVIKEYVNGATDTSNNRMELCAVMMALLYIYNNEKDTEVVIYTDSQYLVKTLHGEYSYKYNIDLFENIFLLFDLLPKTSVEWVKGHADNKFNKCADKLCTQAYKTIKF